MAAIPSIFSRFVPAIAGALLVGGAALAQEHETAKFDQQSWTFAGIFGTYDRNQLQRGFQVFQQVCSNCHSADLLAFRNLAEPGGPEYSEDQVKTLAATFTIADPEAIGGERPAIPADHWPNPWASPADAKAANNGVVPPDFSVIAKARFVPLDFPWWVFNYFTAYQEGGPDYIYNLLNGYHDQPPADFELRPGQYYNDFFPAKSINMPPPLSDGVVDYEGDAVPETAAQYATDVSAFLMWVAEPHLVARKELGFRVLTFLIVLAGLMYFSYRRLWRDVRH